MPRSPQNQSLENTVQDTELDQSLKNKIERLSIHQLEMLSKIRLSIENADDNEEGYADAYAEQKQIIHYLADLFEKGGPRAAKNTLKAKSYRDLENDIPSSTDSMLGGPNSFYTATGWFHFIRLYILRSLMVGEYFFKTTLIPRIYGIGGVFYVAQFLFDVFDILSSVIRPAETDQERKLSFWQLRAQRFKNAINEEGRLSHMWNALVWGTLNALTFFVFGGPIATILTLSGLSIDGVTELIKNGKNNLDYQKLIKENAKELEAANKELKNLKMNNLPLSENEKLDRQKKISTLEKDIKKYKAYETQLTGEMISAKNSQAQSFAFTLLILTGIALTFFPPTMAVGIGLTIFGLALDLGTKLYAAYEKFSPKPIPVAKTKDMIQPNKGPEHEYDKKLEKNHSNQLTSTASAVASALAITQMPAKPQVVINEQSPVEKTIALKENRPLSVEGIKGYQTQNVFNQGADIRTATERDEYKPQTLSVTA